MQVVRDWSSPQILIHCYPITAFTKKNTSYTHNPLSSCFLKIFIKLVAKEVSFKSAFTSDPSKPFMVPMPGCLQTVSVQLNCSQACSFALQFQQVYCSINHTSPVATLQEKKGNCLEKHHKNNVGHQRLGELPEYFVEHLVGGLMVW